MKALDPSCLALKFPRKHMFRYEYYNFSVYSLLDTSGGAAMLSARHGSGAAVTTAASAADSPLDSYRADFIGCLQSP